MALELGNLLGAAANITSAINNEQKGIKEFLSHINSFGVQVKNNFEVNFSALEDITFFISSIELPGLHQNFTQLYYNGRRVDIPINHEYDHEFSMTILNDAQGYIYSAIVAFIEAESTNVLATTGYTMTIKARNGDDNYPGSEIIVNGVRLESITGLTFAQNDNDIQTFTISGKLIDFTVTPGKLGTTAEIFGTFNSLLK